MFKACLKLFMAFKQIIEFRLFFRTFSVILWSYYLWHAPRNRVMFNGADSASSALSRASQKPLLSDVHAHSNTRTRKQLL